MPTVHSSSEIEESLSLDGAGELAVEPAAVRTDSEPGVRGDDADSADSCLDRGVAPEAVEETSPAHAIDTFTIWDSLRNTKGRRSRKPWADMFASKVFQDPPSIADKRLIPGWSPATFSGDKRSKGSVEEVTALVLDYDAKLTRTTIEEAEVAWQHLFGVIHTTWSSRKDAPCFRVILPFSTAVSAEAYPAIWEWARDEAISFGQHLDPSAKDASRLWFLPARRPGSEADYELRMLRGTRMLDPDAIRAKLDGDDGRTDPAPIPVEARVDRARQYVARMPAAIQGQDGSRATFKAALALVRGFGLEQEDALRVLRQEYNPRCQPPWSDEELRHKVDDAGRSSIPLGYLLVPDRPSAFTRGDEVEVAARYVASLGSDAVFTDGRTYVYSEGIWRPLETQHQVQAIASYAGSPVVDGKVVRPLRLSARGCKGVLELAQAKMSAPSFFNSAPAGLAFANGFATLRESRVALGESSPDNRARFAYPFPHAGEPCPLWDEFLGSLWEGDEDSADKQAVLQEFVGASLFGLAPRMKRCLMLFGDSNSGKSTLLDVVRSLFPDGSTTAVERSRYAAGIVLLGRVT